MKDLELELALGRSRSFLDEANRDRLARAAARAHAATGATHASVLGSLASAIRALAPTRHASPRPIANPACSS